MRRYEAGAHRAQIRMGCAILRFYLQRERNVCASARRLQRRHRQARHPDK